MGYRMYVETTDGKELLCGGKLFGYVKSSLCESYGFLKGNCYFTNQRDQLCELDHGNCCEVMIGKLTTELIEQKSI